MTSRLEGVLILLCCVLSLTAILFMVAGGAEGPLGPTGVQGTPGLQGVAGTQGLVGPAGPQGSSGPTGTQGPKGSPGVQGLQGIPGEVGLSESGTFTQLYTQDFRIDSGASVYLYGSGFPKDPELYFKDSDGDISHYGEGDITRTCFREKVKIPSGAEDGLGYFFACEVDSKGSPILVYATWPVWVD